MPRTRRSLLDQAAALRRENPSRTGAQIARIVSAANGGRGPSARTVERHLRRLGLSRAQLRGERSAFGRFEAERPNDLWVADCLHGPVIEGRRAILFAVLDDHSRLVVGAAVRARGDDCAVGGGAALELPGARLACQAVCR